MPTNFPSGVQSYGIPLPSSGEIPITKGSVFHVDSGHTDASDNNPGTNPGKPLATIDAAIGKCTANNGDIILVSPGHAETVAGAAGINIDVAGVRIIGIGWGADRPTITMSAVASTIAMAAASCWFENFLILVEHDVTVVIDVNAADCMIKNVEFRNRIAATAREFVTAIDINGGAANACDRTKVYGCKFTAETAGSTQAIELGEVADFVEIVGCVFWGDYSTACVHNPTGKVLTNLLIGDCFMENANSGSHGIELVSACTGLLVRNLYDNNITQATGVDPGACRSFECYQCDAVDVSGILTPVVT